MSNQRHRDSAARLCSPSLVRSVVALLRERGREATPRQVVVWSEKMPRLYKRVRDKDTTPSQWLQAAIDERPIATLALHLHFGDAL